MQYIVNENDLLKREEFYDYILNNYNMKISYPFNKERFIDNHFPFVIESDNTFWICDSITCLACASSKKVIKTLNDYINVIEKE